MRLKLARVAKIDVFLHWTFFLAPAYLIFVSRSQNIDWQIIGILLGLLVAVFTCVLLHEYGHALMARWFGVETKDIIITPIGGLARLQGMPRRPIEEFMITIAGPLVNLVIAIIFALIIFASDGNWIPGVADDPLASVVSSAQNSTVSGYEGLTDFLPLMLWINMVLFLFNLIPAFPMDGGRILRSSLAFVIPHRQATLVAGILGQIFSFVFAAFGLMYAQYSLVLIGIFIFFAARYEMAMSKQLMLYEQEAAARRAGLHEHQDEKVGQVDQVVQVDPTTDPVDHSDSLIGNE